MVTPAFGDYWRALLAFGAQVLECPLDLKSLEAGTGNGLVTDDLSVSHRSFVSPALSLPVPLVDADRGLLLNNPHNPTGLLFGREAIRPYLEQLPLVVVDEAFMDFLPPEQSRRV